MRAAKIFGQSSYTVISQKFHNERAIFIGWKYGLDIIGYNAPDVAARVGIQTRIREVFARVKVFVDFVTARKPRHLGEKVDIP